MKITTINLRRLYRPSKFLLKSMILLLIAALVCRISINAYFFSDAYTETVLNTAEKRTVIIDAGHGGEDCGAIGTNGVYEKDLNFEIANELGRILYENGFAVVYTRSSDALLYTEQENVYGIRKISDLKNRCKIGAEHQDAIFISIHMNSYKSSECVGAQVYYSEKNDQSYSLASSIQNNIKSRLQSENKRAIKPGENMYLLENLENTAVLIECGFLTNPEECEKLMKKEYQKELSFSIFYGIIEYIEKAV